MDIQDLSKIRNEVLKQTLYSGDDPVDIVFIQAKDGISMCPLEIKGDFSPSKKHLARRRAVSSLLNGDVLHIKNTTELYYFSFDSILNVDYCFEIIQSTRIVNLYIYSTNGIRICSFKPFDPKSDERVEINRSIKSGKGQPSSFLILKERFSKLLGSNKPTQLNIVPLEEPIEININPSNHQERTYSETSKSETLKKVNESSFVDEILSRLDTPKFQSMRDSGMGFGAISMALSFFTKQMISMYPEWDGLFDFDAEKDHVRVTCKKGFNDRITKMAIPYLWKRKSFIENCILFGVEKIVFLDPISSTFDLLEVSKINPNILKEG